MMEKLSKEERKDKIKKLLDEERISKRKYKRMCRDIDEEGTWKEKKRKIIAIVGLCIVIFLINYYFWGM